MKLRSGVALLAGAMAALAIAFLGVKAENALVRESREFNRKILSSMAAQMRYRLDRSMFERFRDIQNAARIDTFYEGTDAERRRVLERLRDSLIDYAWIGLTDRDGIVIASTDGLLVGQDLSARPWFAPALTAPHAGDVHEASPEESVLPHEPGFGPLRFVDLAAPVVDDRGQVVGVLAAHLRWSWAHEIKRSIREEGAILDGIETFILRADGTVLQGPEPFPGQAFPCAVADRAKDHVAFFANADCADGGRYMYAQSDTQGFRFYPGLGWRVVVRQSQEAALAPIAALRAELAMRGVILALSIAGLGWLAAGWITRPLQRLAQAADLVTRGDRDTPLPKASAFREFRWLFWSLQSMIGELTRTQRQVEARAAETALEKRRLDTIVSSMTDALAVVRGGRVEFANPTFQALTDPDARGADQGPSVAELFHPDDRVRVDAALAAATAGGARDGRNTRVEARIITPEGKIRHVEASLSGYDEAGGPGVLIILRDVTDSILAARQLAHSQRIEALGNLAGGIAHDFNNLLTVIVGNLDLVEAALRDQPKARVQAEHALEAALRGAQLTRQLLAFSRKQPLVPQQLDLNALLTGTVSLLRRTLGEHVEVVTELDPDLWAVEADRAQMESAITNLAINARDAMPDGGTLLLRTRNRPADGTGTDGRDAVVIEVIDSGTGIDADVLPHVLEPFFTTKDEGKGTGLGLPMIHGFVHQSGGAMDVDSVAGHGTRVTLVFPRGTGAADDPARDSAPLPPLPEGLSVLLVEDRDDVRGVLAEQLRQLGCRVTEAPNGTVALDRLDPGFDLLLTDIRLPGGMHGAAIAAAARRRWPDLPVVFVTGHAGLVPDEEARLRRMGPTVDKPFRLPDMVRAIRIALDRRGTGSPSDSPQHPEPPGGALA